MNYSYSSRGGFVADYAPDVRAEFIQKVYSLFFVSLLITIGVGAFCVQPAVLPVMAASFPVLIVAYIISAIALMFARKTSFWNIAIFYVFSVVQGAFLGPLLANLDRYAPGIPLEAAVLTAAVFGGLSLYAIVSKKDFSFLSGFLFVGLIGLIVAGILTFFIHAALLSMLYAIGGVLIFSGYVLYDTSMIMRRLGPDQAIIGAISLYLDLINLFLFILRLLTNLQSRD